MLCDRGTSMMKVGSILVPMVFFIGLLHFGFEEMGEMGWSCFWPTQSKADLAKKQKINEDKTFGLKNKNKSKNARKYVESLRQSIQPKPDPKSMPRKREGKKGVE
ncbi:zinc finger CCCH domain-containing protein 11-like isoform X1 [Cynara cardunculus var. scolymus]|uniref:zinc finger CCCH domain-containing protein 11-like isoform X1 n=2 Tax=Cynara cardunculus var. scolymus TaxID=59895 RepID=UPI000D62C4D2|nr:zinc finger CCCH domain-containing protein 11-like isoform X1 [Cynara cardunculus var. scolymus]